MAEHVPTPWTFSDRNWRNEVDADGHLYVTGGRHFAHDDGDSPCQCDCDCDGDREFCGCTCGCGWVTTSVCVVPNNPTAGDIPRATAAYLCRSANTHARLAALCRRLIEAGWQGFPEDARESLRRTNPEHAVVRAEAELAEIVGGGG